MPTGVSSSKLHVDTRHNAGGPGFTLLEEDGHSIQGGHAGRAPYASFDDMLPSITSRIGQSKYTRTYPPTEATQASSHGGKSDRAPRSSLIYPVAVKLCETSGAVCGLRASLFNVRSQLKDTDAATNHHGAGISYR